MITDDRSPRDKIKDADGDSTDQTPARKIDQRGTRTRSTDNRGRPAGGGNLTLRPCLHLAEADMAARKEVGCF
jgi:hypothetical protein